MTLEQSGYKIGPVIEQTKSHTEQRRHQRFDLKLPIELLRDGSKKSGQTKNLSSCGVLFTSEEPVSLGEAIEYVITLPKTLDGEVRLRCVGKVVREDSTRAFAATMDRYEFVRG